MRTIKIFTQLLIAVCLLVFSTLAMAAGASSAKSDSTASDFVCTVGAPSVVSRSICGTGSVTVTIEAYSTGAGGGGGGAAAVKALVSTQGVIGGGGGGGTPTYTVYWFYSASSAWGSQFASGNLLTVNIYSTTTYYAGVWSSAGCLSSLVPVTAGIVTPTVAFAGSYQSLCGTSGTSLSANTPATGTGSWSVSSGPSTSSSQFSNVSSPTSAFTPAGGQGNYVLTWTITNPPCSTSSSNVTISFFSVPTASNAGPAQQGASTCGLSTVILAGNTPGIGSGTWSVASDSPTSTGYSFGNPNSPTSSFSGTAGATYDLNWVIANGSCASLSETSVTFNRNPTPANAGGNQTICVNGYAALGANAPSVGAGSWSVAGGPSTSTSQFNNTASPSAIFTPAGGAGTYVLTWTISNSPCPASSSNVTITVNPGPVTGSISASSTSICLGQSVTLSSSGGSTPIYWASTNGASGSVTSWDVFAEQYGGQSSFSFTPSTPGTYSFYVYYQNACGYCWDTNSCGAPVYVNVTVNPGPVTGSISASSTSICLGQSVTLSSSGSGTPHYWASTNGANGSPTNWDVFTDQYTGQSSFSFTPTTPGTYSFYTYYADACGYYCWNTNSCGSSVYVNVTVNPTLNSYAGPNMSICLPGGVSLDQASAPPNGSTGLWSVVSGPNTASSQFSTTTGLGIFTPTREGTYVIAWTISKSPCPSATSYATITASARSAAANAGPDQTGAATCGQTTVTLAGNAANGTGTWSIVTGTGGTITSPSNPSSTFSGTAGSSYTLRWTISNGVCASSTDDVVITFNRNPTTATIGPNQIVCGLTSATLSGNTPTIGTGTWILETDFSPGGSIANVSDPHSSFSGNLGGTYGVIWAITNSPCPASSKELTIAFNNIPTAAVSVTQQSICSGGVTSITVTNPNSIAGTVLNWSATPVNVTGYVNSSGPSGSIIGQTLNSVNGGTVNYSVTATANGCTSAPVTSLVTVNPNPSLPTALSSTSVCGPGNVTLSATPGVNGNTIRWYNVSTGGAPLGSATQSISSPSTFYVDSYNTTTTCVSSSRSSITVTPNDVPPLPVAFAAAPVFGSGQATLYANASDYGTNFVNNWYTTPTGGTAVTGSSFTSATLTAGVIGAIPYYVSIFNYTTTCEGPRQPVYALAVPYIVPMTMTKFTVKTDGILTDDQLYTLTNAQADSTLLYLDGLQRAVQRVDKKASPTNYDLVTPVEYDANGRTAKDYLPYASKARSGNFQSQYQTTQSSFYSASGDKVADDANPYALANYEQSPLGRLLEQGAPGAAWQPGTGHSQKLAYSFNTGATASPGEEVRLFRADGTSTSFYGANTLSRTQVTDANGHIIISYTDGVGHTLAKKQQLDNTIAGVMVNFLETYYIYNDLGQLVYILPPKAVAQLKSASWAVSQPFFDTWCFQFTYDYRGRLTQKKSPGQAAMYIAYDILNRPVLAQTGILRTTNQWQFVKYDVRNRPVMAGLYTDNANTTLAAIQTLLNGLYTSGNATYPVGSSFETKGNVVHGYTNNSFPKFGPFIQVQNVSYYDNYDFDNSGYDDFAYTKQTLVNEGKQARAVGLPTGGKSLILGTANFLYSYVFYDKYDRTIQVRSNNYLSPTVDNLTTITYDSLTRAVKLTKTYHNAGGTNQMTLLQTPGYDAKGRVVQINHSINGAANQLVAQYQYNELGQAVAKQLHNTGGANFMQTVDLRYNIRGWLTNINNAQLANDGGVTNNDTNDYFGMELVYNTNETSGLGNTPLFNGNLSAIKWKGADGSNAATGQRSYNFTYDKSDQLISSAFQKYGTSAWNQEQNTLNETMSYDHNGNVVNLQRNQNVRTLSGTSVINTATPIDNLTYTYANGNQLSKVDDASANTSGFSDGSNTATEYTYDTHGNLTADLNKGISAITYNQLGKAQQITFTNGNVVAYTYDAGGNKLKMASTVGGTTTTTSYVNGFVYNTVGAVNTLNFFSSPEGRVIKNGSNFEYQYAIADHQGNTRVLFTSAPQTSQTVTATFETANQATEATQFQNYPTPSHINVVATNAHNGSNSEYLNGGLSGQVGVAKSYKVFPGDQLQIQAYAKYSAPSGTSSNLTGFALALLNAFNLAVPAPGEVGTPSSAINAFGGIEAGGWGDGTTDQSDPKVFVTIVIFDKNYKFLDVAYQQLTSSGSMNASYTVKEAGYAFMYISNEQAVQTDVYFDDVTMTYIPTNILQSNEYYPFGLQTANSWTRDNTTNNFLYDAGNELNTTTAMYDLPYRNYDAALGRFFQVDPLAHRDHDLTPYQYSRNNPVYFNDPTGLVEDEADFEDGSDDGGSGEWSEDGGGGEGGEETGGNSESGTNEGGSSTSGNTWTYTDQKTGITVKYTDNGNGSITAVANGVTFTVSSQTNSNGTTTYTSTSGDFSASMTVLSDMSVMGQSNLTQEWPLTTTIVQNSDRTFWYIQSYQMSNVTKYQVAVLATFDRDGNITSQQAQVRMISDRSWIGFPATSLDMPSDAANLIMGASYFRMDPSNRPDSSSALGAMNDYMEFISGYDPRSNDPSLFFPDNFLFQHQYDYNMHNAYPHRR